MSGIYRGPNGSATADALNIDGDKGDLTISNSGLEWTINPDAVDFSKMQNISTDVLLGRASVGSGNIEEITCTQAGRDLLDDVDGSAQRTTLGLGSIATQGDGDKGDIVVSGSGGSWTINNDVIFNANVNSAAAIESSKLQFTPLGGGAVARTVQSKLRDVVSAKDFGAVGDGVADDTAAILKVKAAADGQRNAVVNLGGGKYVTTAPIWTNHVSPTSMQFDKPAVLGLFEGTDADPDTTTNDPVLWVQKYTKYDNGTDRFAHNPGALFGEVIIKGTGIAGGNDTDATWIGCLGNVVQQGVNQGSAASPDYDAYGNVVGIAGFARINGYPGNGNIACGVWAYTSGPQMDSTTWGNLPNTNWSVVGVEANIELNHPDIGEKAVLAGKGASVGYLAYNYRAPAAGVRDWTFGLALTGSPNDGNFASPDIDNWSGFYTGILLDKIKAKGIRFGQYFKTGSYGIYFPDSYVGTQEPLAAIYLGNSKINLGQYVGSTFNNNDLWHNGGGLFFRTGGVTGRALVSLASTVTLQAGTTSFSSAGNVAFGMGSVASAVNAMTAFGAATGGAPALSATGSDTNIDIELRPKGTGRVWVGAWTSNADVAINGYITVKDSTGVIRKLATIA